MNRFKNVMAIVSFLFSLTIHAGAQQKTTNDASLDARQQSIVSISALTAKGDLEQLKDALNQGLEAGLTVNEIREVLVHLYAYCGFPRSLQGINTFITVLDSRRSKGITEKTGREAMPVIENMSKYDQGKKALQTLTGQPERAEKTGYAAFAPVIDTFLKEHLFADIFGRDILNYTEREIVTVSALVTIGGVEPMMRSHMNIALRLGVTESQLTHLLSMIEEKIGNEEAEVGRGVLAAINNNAAQPSNATTRKNVFSKGAKAPATNFTGTVWVNMVMQVQEGLNSSVGTVTFEPGARSNWHRHPGGQILLVTEGKGYYQERGQPVKMMQKGDLVKCLPGVEHWHGASPKSSVTHIAIGPNAERGSVVWLKRVTDEEYQSFK